LVQIYHRQWWPEAYHTTNTSQWRVDLKHWELPRTDDDEENKPNSAAQLKMFKQVLIERSII
jgi:hypothetical protein